MVSISETVAALEADQNLTATAYRLGRRLDDRRPDGAAALQLQRDELTALASVSNWSSARKLLAQLRPAIEWSADGESISLIYPLQNGARSKMERDARAEMERDPRRNGAQNAAALQNGAKNQPDPLQNGAEDAAALQNGAALEPGQEEPGEPLPEKNDPENAGALQNGAATSHSVLVSKLVRDPLQDQDQDPNYLTNSAEERAEMEREPAGGEVTPKYEPHPEHRPQNKNEELTTARLLQDPAVGIDRNSAIAVGKNRDIELVRRAVWRYLEGKEAGQFHSAGIILTWLRQPDAYGLAHYPPEFERSALYREYRTGRELSLERKLEAEAAEAAKERQSLASELDPARPLGEDPAEPADQSPEIPADVEPDTPEAAYYLLRHRAEEAYRSMEAAGKASAGDSFARLWLALEPAQLHKAEPRALVLRYQDPAAAHTMQRSRNIARRILRTITKDDYEITIQIDPETAGEPESAAEPDPA